MNLTNRIATILKMVFCVGTLSYAAEVTGTVSPSVVSTGPPATVCRSCLNGGSFYEADKVLDRADVFVSLERKMSD